MNLQEKLNLVKGKTCWGVLAGYPNASFIYLHFGERIKRKKVINNEKLPYDLQKYEGEYYIGIFCAWRLQQGKVPITGSCEPNNHDGPLVNGVKRLVNEKVTLIEIIDECGDLRIQFDDKVLNVFCNYTGNEDIEYCVQDNINWILRSKDKDLVVVEQGCRLVVNEQ